MTENVVTSTPNCYDLRQIALGDIFVYDPDIGVTCLYCRDAKKQVDFARGKIYEDNWKLDLLKRHLGTKVHLDSVEKLRNQNPSLPPRGLLHLMQRQTALDSESKKEYTQRKRSNSNQV